LISNRICCFGNWRRQEVEEPMKRWIEIAFDQRADLKQIEFQQLTAEEEIKKP